MNTNNISIETANTPEDSFSKAIPEKRCYTVEELQIMLGIARGSVYKLLAKHEFRWFKVGSSYRISKRSFDDWLDSLT